ncbi:MAG: carboxypeptidase regulatory-like domain-containing protein, partial [Candidatus Omnitrophica bacterium]|nr:carboxypeptidase regulatory-like domain-containing protein [Candidatus Omnitrophota bacterium]
TITIEYKRGIHTEIITFFTHDGNFTVTVEPNVEVVLTVNAEGYVEGKSVPIKLKEGETVENIVIALKRARGMLQGKVVDDVSGEPIAMAVIRIGEQLGPRDINETLTSTDGTFILDGIPEEATLITVLHSEYIPRVIPISELEGQDEIILSKGATLEGKVLLNGKPVIGAQIMIGSTSVSTRNIHKSVTTKTDGSYRIPGLIYGSYYECANINGEDGKLKRMMWESIEIKENFSKHDFIFQDGEGVLEGNVYLKTNIPAVGLRVELSIVMETIEGLWIDRRYADTDVNGRYKFEGLTFDTYTVEINWGTEGKENHISEKVTISGNERVRKNFILEE